MADVKIVLDGARMAALLRSPAGPVGRHMIERAEIVKQAAKAKANHKTGCLEDSIVKRVEEDPVTGFRIRIVADTTPCSPERKSYALWVHEGSQPHAITAREGGVLSFVSHGERIFAKSVQHPGYKGNKFLSDALPLAVV
jgi:hypothetical protein